MVTVGRIRSYPENEENIPLQAITLQLKDRLRRAASLTYFSVTRHNRACSSEHNRTHVRHKDIPMRHMLDMSRLPLSRNVDGSTAKRHSHVAAYGG